MLVAYGPDGRSITAEEASLEQLLAWSHARALYCPNCRANVHVRGGPEKRTQLHFAHLRGECAWSTEAESTRHACGKMLLAVWLSSQFPQAEVTLEQRLAGPNRIADIFVEHADGRRWAVEFQCAPLDLEEWRRRHGAYREAGMLDIWIVGSNRREKQEGFIEAILASTHEIMFLDPLTTPALIWLRWPISRASVQSWQQGGAGMPVLAGRLGRMGYVASLSGQLQQVRLGGAGNFVHAARSALELRARLLLSMSDATSVDEVMLVTYLRQHVSREAVHNVLLPLLRAYVRDPELLRRYNYGRGSLSERDSQRIHKARRWLKRLAQGGFSLPELLRELPCVGPYAAFAAYIELLLALS
jgi:hypothetical protein